MASKADVLVDTNLLIQHLRQSNGVSALTRSLFKYGWGAISVISLIEYEVGELQANRHPNFTQDFPRLRLLTLTQPVLRRAPYIQAQSIAVNRRMDMADLLIASTAVYHNLPLLTLNTDHFRHVKRLRLIKVL